jgi:hypothetical protein
VKRILVLAAVVATALVLASAASADALGCAHGNNCQASSGGGGTSPSGTLPFTGIDLAAIAGVGGLLLVGGLTLHRVSRRRS